VPEYADDDYQDEDEEEFEEEPRSKAKQGRTYDQTDYKTKKYAPVRVTADDGEEFVFDTRAISAKVFTRLRAKESSVEDIMSAVLTDQGLELWDEWLDEHDPPMAMVDDIARDLYKEIGSGGKGKSRRRRRTR